MNRHDSSSISVLPHCRRLLSTGRHVVDRLLQAEPRWIRYARFHTVAGLLLAALWASPCRAQELVVTTQKADGIYQVGEVIRWRIEWKGTGPVSEASYSVKKGGLTKLTEGTLALTNGAAVLEAKLDEPGTLLAEVNVTSTEGKKQTAYGGAVAAPERIVSSAGRPKDFDAFWEAKLKELKAVPANPKLEIGQCDKPGVQYWKITMDNIRGTHIQGQLARPTQGDKLPALLIVQWAGVYGLQKSWVADRAAEGWLVLNINAHDLPIDQPEAFYKDQFAGPLKNYWEIGNESRETSYFLRMYLSCYRAAEYLAQRPDWDGKTLVVQGGSQGGQQALITRRTSSEDHRRIGQRACRVRHAGPGHRARPGLADVVLKDRWQEPGKGP